MFPSDHTDTIGQYKIYFYRINRHKNKQMTYITRLFEMTILLLSHNNIVRSLMFVTLNSNFQALLADKEFRKNFHYALRIFDAHTKSQYGIVLNGLKQDKNQANVNYISSQIITTYNAFVIISLWALQDIYRLSYGGIRMKKLFLTSLGLLHGAYCLP